MSIEPIKIKFKNRFNPKSSFDFIRLEKLFQRQFADHTPEQLHRVEFFILFIVLEGEGAHTIDFMDYPYKKGTILSIRKDQIHKFQKNDKVRGNLLMFTDDFLLRYLDQLEARKTLQLFNELLGVPKIQLSELDFSTILGHVSRIEDEYFNNKDTYSLGIIRSELHILITKLYRIKSRDNQMVVNKKYLPEFVVFQELLEKNVSKRLRVSDYAHKMGLSTKTLNTISKNIIHKTAKEFIDEISIKQIKRLLINTSLSIKEIAYASGFEETTNFYKYFKKHTNTTPDQFRSEF